jgi:phosphopantetheinyl transferase (holo-ACP synthase)
VAPLDPEAVFTPDERRHCGESVERFAGRLAAKLALRDLLALSSSGSLADIAIVAGRHSGDEPCRGMHRPEVALVGGAAMASGGRSIALSITHVPSLAIAVCVMADEPEEGP